MQGEVELDVTAWRELYPAFADVTVWPDARLQNYWEQAKCFVWPVPWHAIGRRCLTQAMGMMLAHLCELTRRNQAGQGTAGIQTGATVDKVSVSFQAPPVKSGWQHWLGTTPYGMELWALLSVKAAGGFYVGGSIERYGFRKAGGGF